MSFLGRIGSEGLTEPLPEGPQGGSLCHFGSSIEGRMAKQAFGPEE